MTDSVPGKQRKGMWEENKLKNLAPNGAEDRVFSIAQSDWDV